MQFNARVCQKKQFMFLAQMVGQGLNAPEQLVKEDKGK